MSIAGEVPGRFAYPADTGGLLQQAYPALSDCFAVGQLPLPAPGQASRPVGVSSDGRYGWIDWRQATCCVGGGAASRRLRAPATRLP